MVIIWFRKQIVTNSSEITKMSSFDIMIKCYFIWQQLWDAGFDVTHVYD